LQETIALGDRLFAFWRVSTDQEQRILIVCNISAETQILTIPDHPLAEGSGVWRDLIERTALSKSTKELKLYPYQCAWLEALD